MTAAELLGIEGIDEIRSLDIEGSAVYCARQFRHNRLVAIKILDRSQEPLMPAARFELRRTALRRFVADQGVVSLYEHGVTASGQRYLIMPYFKMGSLADQLSHGPMPWHRAAELVKRTAEIIAGAHDLGLVLANLKPSNVLLADASSPLVAVYGMATRSFDDGSPSYRAPEAGPGTRPAAPADVYSLALILAALIAGRAPNRGPVSREFMTDVASKAPERIVEVIERGLAEGPATRFPDGRHLGLALGRATGSDEPPLVSSPDSMAGEGPIDLDVLLGRQPPPPLVPPPPVVSAVAGSPGPGPSPDPAEPPDDSGSVEPDSTTPTDRQLAPSHQPGVFLETGGATSQLVLGVAPPAPVPDTTNADTPGSDTQPPPPLLPDTTNADRPSPPLLLGDDRSTSPLPAATGAGFRLPPGPVGTLRSLPPTTAGEEPPFRAFDRQGSSALPANRFVRLVDPIQGLWDQLQRSLGTVLALVGFAVIAGLVGTLAVRDLQGPSLGTVTSSTFTPVQESGSPSTFAPTSEAPVFLEPPATHQRSTAELTALGSAPAGPSTAASAQPVTPTTATTATAAPTTAPASPPPTTAPPTTRDPLPTTAAASATRPRPPTTAATTGPPSTQPPTTEDDDNDSLIGPPIPLIEDATVTRIRATTARLRFSSSTCVTASFSYGPPGGRMTTVTGGSRCATSFTLLLGTVTPRLAPGTTYSVTISATDGSGATSTQQLSFTTLG